MKKLMLALALSMLVAPSFAMATDEENSAKTTVDHSKNPITGTETTTKKTKRLKRGAGKNSKMETVETTKKHTDGTVDHTVETNTDSETK